MAESPVLFSAAVEDLSPAIFPDAEELQGQHITLRRLKETDLQSLWSRLGVHDEVWVHWPAGPYTSSSEFMDELRELTADSSLVIYTVVKSGEAAGLVFLQVTSLDRRVMEIGACYGPDLQRSIGATEAFHLAACYVFDKLNNRRLQWKTDSMNVASRRAAERWGFKYEGCLRQDGIQKGRNRDTVWYSIIDREWPLCKRALEAWLTAANFDVQGNQKKSLNSIRAALSEE